MDDYVEKLNNHPNVDDNVLTIFIHFWIRNIPQMSDELVYMYMYMYVLCMLFCINCVSKAGVELLRWLWGAVAQWSEHLQLKQEALGSIPGGYPGFFSLPAGLLM